MYSPDSSAVQNWKSMEVIKKIHDENQHNIEKDFTNWRRITNSGVEPKWYKHWLYSVNMFFLFGLFFYNNDAEIMKRKRWI